MFQSVVLHRIECVAGVQPLWFFIVGNRSIFLSHLSVKRRLRSREKAKFCMIHG